MAPLEGNIFPGPSLLEERGVTTWRITAAANTFQTWGKGLVDASKPNMKIILIIKPYCQLVFLMQTMGTQHYYWADLTWGICRRLWRESGSGQQYRAAQCLKRSHLGYIRTLGWAPCDHNRSSPKQIWQEPTWTHGSVCWNHAPGEVGLTLCPRLFKCVAQVGGLYCMHGIIHSLIYYIIINYYIGIEPPLLRRGGSI